LRIPTLVVPFFLLSTGAFLSADDTVFQLKDPRGDDHIDGTAILPSEGELRFGDLDLVSLSAKADKDGTKFEVEFASSIEQPDTRVIDAGGRTLASVARLGFYRFNIDIYIDTDRQPASGSTNTLPGRNALIDPQAAWEKMICLTPRPVETRGLLKRYLVRVLEERLEASRGRVDPEDTSEIFADASLDLERSYYFPERGVRVAGRKLTFLVPSPFLGGTAKGEWSYVVLLTVAKIDDTLSFGNFGGAQVPYTLMNLPVGEGAWSDRLGTSRKGAALLPPILDMFVPEGMKQEEVLRNFNANTKQMVILPGIVPSDSER
jgi:hypothetical protein